MIKSTCLPKLKAACIAATVATGWGVGQQAHAITQDVPVTIQVNSLLNLTDVYFVYATGTSTIGDVGEAIPLNDITGNVGFFQNIVLDYNPYSFDAVGSAYSLMGLYSDPSNPDPGERSGVSLTLNTGVALNAVNIGLTFTDVFPAYTEDEIITALQTDDTSTLQNFLNDYADDAFNSGISSGTGIVNFSVADAGGTAAAVPEPSAFLLITAAGSLLLLQRRKRPT